MKRLKLTVGFVLAIFLGFTSCQSEENQQIGTNPNANNASSPTAQNFERVAQNDGSDDDFLDGNACTELLFPLTAKVNGQQITLISKSDLSLVLNIMGQFNDDSDTIEFSFPISVRKSNYTEVVISSQQELDTLKQECENAENQGEDAISCIDFQFPITMLTYNIALEQTGSVVLQSEQQLYTFMTDLQNNELFAVNYPISATLSNGTSLQINSDIEFQNAISDCVQFEDEKDQAATVATEVEAILTNSKFKVESFITAGVNTANNYANWTIDFTNDLKIIAKNVVNTTLGQIEGTYSVSSETEAIVNINFSNSTAVSALSNEWVVDTYSSTLITLKSKVDASVTLSFKKL